MAVYPVFPDQLAAGNHAEIRGLKDDMLKK
jgi:hypothetical protein